MCHFVAPRPGLTIALHQGGKGPAGPEGIAHIPDSALHAPFLMGGAYLTRLRREMVMSAEFQQTRMKQNLITAPFQHRRLQIVIENHARLTVPGLKSAHVTAQEILH